MIHHIVTLELASEDTAECASHANEIVRRVEAFGDLPGVVSLRVHRDLGLVTGHWPLVLVGVYVDVPALEAYQADPRHREVLAWMNDGVVRARSTVDYDED
ncbi:MAG: Dabb family protein [Acidimicrobiales bacterium]